MILKFFSKNFFIHLFFVFLIFISDRLSKIYIINESLKNFDNLILTSTYLNIRLIWNEGIAFGLLSFDDKALYHSLSLLILVIILILPKVIGQLEVWHMKLTMTVLMLRFVMQCKMMMF